MAGKRKRRGRSFLRRYRGIAAIRQKEEGRGRAGDEAVFTMSLQNKKESVEEENAVHETLRSSDSYLESEIIDELSSEGSFWSSQEFSDGSRYSKDEHSVTRNRNRNFFRLTKIEISEN